MKTLDRHGKPYPKPSRAALERAKAHQFIAQALTRMAEQASPYQYAAYVTVIKDEAARHERMLQHFREHYGPNAGI